MVIWLNGAEREVVSAKSIRELTAELKLPSQALLVEHNGVALRRDEWEGCALREGDRIEVITIVAGG